MQERVPKQASGVIHFHLKFWFVPLSDTYRVWARVTHSHDSALFHLPWFSSYPAEKNTEKEGKEDVQLVLGAPRGWGDCIMDARV